MEERPRLVSSSFFWEPASESEGWEVSSFKKSVLVTLSSAFLESAFLRRRTTTGQSCLERRVLRATFLFSTVLSAHPTRWGRVASSIADLQRRLSLSSQLDQNSEPNTRNNLSSRWKSSSMSSRSSSPRRRSDGNPEARFFSPFHAETSTCLQLFGGCCPSPVPRGMGKHVLCGMCDLMQRRGRLEGNALVFCLGFWEKGGLPQSVSNR